LTCTDLGALVKQTKLYKNWKENPIIVKISIGACTSLAFALQSQNFITDAKFIQESLLINCTKKE